MTKRFLILDLVNSQFASDVRNQTLFFVLSVYLSKSESLWAFD